MVRMDLSGNIYYVKGETFNLKLEASEDNVLIDFTDWIIEFKIYKSSTNILTFTNSDYINTSNTGLIIFNISPSLMNLDIGNYLYDLKVTRPSGDIEFWINNKKLVVE